MGYIKRDPIPDRNLFLFFTLPFFPPILLMQYCISKNFVINDRHHGSMLLCRTRSSSDSAV